MDMKKLAMCRICLVENVRMYLIDNKNLQELYEKLTGVPFVSEDRRPMLACFFCCAKLKQCEHFRRKCLKAEKLLSEMLNENYEPNPLINRHQLESFGGFIKSPIVHISVNDEIQIEMDAIKEEQPDICKRQDGITESEEEHQDNELKQKHLHDSCQDVEDIPPHHSAADSEYKDPLTEFKTEVEQEQVSLENQRTEETEELEQNHLHDSYQDVEDIPPQHSAADSEDDAPMMESTEVEQQEVPIKKRKAGKAETNREQLRHQIVELHEHGVAIHEISRQLNVTRNTVRRWIRRFREEGSLSDLRRNNHRPHALSEDQCRMMLRQYTLDSFTPTRQFAAMFEVHPLTVRRHLHAMGTLTQPHKTARLNFAQQYLNFDWMSTVFIDETTLAFSQTGKLHLWRNDNTDDHIIANNAPGRVTANISGWISLAGVGELVNLPPKATAQDYVELLDESVLPTLRTYYPQQEVPTINFVQDNATNAARIVKSWFSNQANLNLISWPPKSADLNPIKHLWDLMVQKWSSGNERSREALIDHCHTVWESFRGTDICQELIGSMHDRLLAVIQNQGEYTRF